MLSLLVVLNTVSQPAVAASARSAEAARVIRIIDGDTITARIGRSVETIRIIGIDTPETKDPRKSVQCFGKEATRQLTKLLRSSAVTLERSPTEDRDKYGRFLRYITVKGNDVGAMLIKDGYAFSYKAFSHPRLDKYNALETEARQAKRGLWAACSTGLTSSGASSAPRAVQPSSSGCTIKGNISAAGVKIYHLPGCGSYKQTIITPSAGEQWFCTESQAKNAGWRKAGNCQ